MIEEASAKININDGDTISEFVVPLSVANEIKNNY